ncbi:MAG: DUF1559 domain-containing protein [Pirellulaceae bacterium]|nr:DUF1559 domain-containing protein [Planctomycetales bacterium]
MKASMLLVRRRDRGFTLVELLVVIAIIGLLVALLLPAVNAAREAARRTQCFNNIRQASLAVINYESARGRLPAGAYSCCWGTWIAEVLPYLEEASLGDLYVHEGKYDRPDSSYRYSGSRNLPVTTHFIDSLTCPTDAGNRTTLPGFLNITSHNYAVNFGNTGFVVRDGDVKTGAEAKVFDAVYAGAPFTISGWTNIEHDYVALKEIKDGTSKTYMMSEVVQGLGNDLRGFSWWGYAAGFLTYLPPNSDQPDVMQSASYCDSREPNNPPCVGPHSASRPMTNAARSRHPGGVVTANCDASVQFTSDDISLGVWRALSTSQGAEIVSGDDVYGTPVNGGGGTTR